ncbi:hypothetical protein KAR91_56375 [Candidatus Pacearchaeota archaeon]|nr:hypothetical protein [Candidatus Pacearchaeota archaeon]
MSNVKHGFRQAQAGDGNSPFFEGVNVTTTNSFTIASAAANVSEIAIALLDGNGDAVAAAQPMTVWLSDAATGAGLTGTSASGTVQAKSASGADFGALTAKKALIAQPLATGIYTLEITDTAKTGFYVCIQNPFTGAVSVSRQLVTGDYGA